MSVQTLNVYTVEVNSASGTQNVYVVSNVATRLAAIQVVFNNGLIPADATMINCTLTATQVVS